MRHCADRIADNNSAMIDDFLEFRSRFGRLFSSKIGQSANVDRIQGAEQARDSAGRNPEFMWRGDLKRFQSILGLGPIEGKDGSDGRQIIELYRGVLGEALFHFVCNRASLRGIARKDRGQGDAVLDLSIVRELDRGVRPLDCLFFLSEKSFANGGSGLPQGGTLRLARLLRLGNSATRNDSRILQVTRIGSYGCFACRHPIPPPGPGPGRSRFARHSGNITLQKVDVIGQHYELVGIKTTVCGGAQSRLAILQAPKKDIENAEAVVPNEEIGIEFDRLPCLDNGLFVAAASLVNGS